MIFAYLLVLIAVLISLYYIATNNIVIVKILLINFKQFIIKTIQNKKRKLNFIDQNRDLCYYNFKKKRLINHTIIISRVCMFGFLK